MNFSTVIFVMLGALCLTTTAHGFELRTLSCSLLGLGCPCPTLPPPRLPVCPLTTNSLPYIIYQAADIKEGNHTSFVHICTKVPLRPLPDPLPNTLSYNDVLDHVNLKLHQTQIDLNAAETREKDIAEELEALKDAYASSRKELSVSKKTNTAMRDQIVQSFHEIHALESKMKINEDLLVGEKNKNSGMARRLDAAIAEAASEKTRGDMKADEALEYLTRLTYSEAEKQVLEAANQVLKADNQALKGGNQVLKDDYQVLMAANQVLQGKLDTSDLYCKLSVTLNIGLIIIVAIAMLVWFAHLVLSNIDVSSTSTSSSSSSSSDSSSSISSASSSDSDSDSDSDSSPSSPQSQPTPTSTPRPSDLDQNHSEGNAAPTDASSTPTNSMTPIEAESRKKTLEEQEQHINDREEPQKELGYDNFLRSGSPIHSATISDSFDPSVHNDSQLLAVKDEYVCYPYFEQVGDTNAKELPISSPSIVNPLTTLTPPSTSHAEQVEVKQEEDVVILSTVHPLDKSVSSTATSSTPINSMPSTKADAKEKTLEEEEEQNDLGEEELQKEIERINAIPLRWESPVKRWRASTWASTYFELSGEDDDDDEEEEEEEEEDLLPELDFTAPRPVLSNSGTQPILSPPSIISSSGSLSPTTSPTPTPLPTTIALPPQSAAPPNTFHMGPSSNWPAATPPRPSQSSQRFLDDFEHPIRSPPSIISSSGSLFPTTSPTPTPLPTTIALPPQSAAPPNSFHMGPSSNWPAATPPRLSQSSQRFIDDFENHLVTARTLSSVYCPFLTDVLDLWAPNQRVNTHEIVLQRHWYMCDMPYDSVVNAMRAAYRSLGVFEMVRYACRASFARSDGEPGLPAHICGAEQELLLGDLGYRNRNSRYIPAPWASQFYCALLANPLLARQINALGGHLDTSVQVLRASIASQSQ